MYRTLLVAVHRYYTERIALHRRAEPEELAGAIAYLFTDDASYVTAATLLVDGGFIGCWSPSPPQPSQPPARWNSGNDGGRIAMAVSMWRDAVHRRFRRVPGRCRFGAGRGCVRHGRSPGERGRPGERRANDTTGCAHPLGSITDGDANADPDA